MGKFINYLQQPESIHAINALLLNTRAFGGFRVADMVEWFDGEGITVNVNELKERWHELACLGFAVQSRGFTASWERRIGGKIGYVLTEKGNKVAEALTEAINYIKKL